MDTSLKIRIGGLHEDATEDELNQLTQIITDNDKRFIQIQKDKVLFNNILAKIKHRRQLRIRRQK